MGVVSDRNYVNKPRFSNAEGEVAEVYFDYAKAVIGKEGSPKCRQLKLIAGRVTIQTERALKP